MSISSTGNSPNLPPISTALYMEYLLTATPQPIAQAQIMRATIDRQQGDTKRFARMPLAPMSPNAVPDNSSGPAPITLSYSAIDITMEMHVQSAIYNVKATLISQIDWIVKTIEAQEVSMLRTENYITSITISAAPTQLAASGGTNGDSPTNYSLIDANNDASVLQNANAPYTTGIAEGANKIGTNPVATGYVMLTNTIAMASFRNDTPNFQLVSNYSDPNIALPGEIGSYGPIRVLMSTDWPVYTNGLSLLGNPILQGTITSIQSYAIVIHSSLYRSISAIGEAFYGVNMLQTGTVSRSYYGVGIVQQDWILNVLYTAA